ncbi:MAG: hypothetical protein U1E60_04395 [Reyranellaceae bacterium]
MAAAAVEMILEAATTTEGNQSMQIQDENRTQGRNPFFVVFEGEDIAAAMDRHYRDYGRGPLVLVRDFNVVPSRARRSGGERRRAAA